MDHRLVTEKSKNPNHSVLDSWAALTRHCTWVQQIWVSEGGATPLPSFRPHYDTFCPTSDWIAGYLASHNSEALKPSLIKLHLIWAVHPAALLPCLRRDKEVNGTDWGMTDHADGGPESGDGDGFRGHQQTDPGLAGAGSSRPLPSSLPIAIPRVTVSSVSDRLPHRAAWRFSVGSVLSKCQPPTNPSADPTNDWKRSTSENFGI